MNRICKLMNSRIKLKVCKNPYNNQLSLKSNNLIMAINVYEIEMYTLILTYSILLECSIYSFSDQTRFSSTVIPCFSLKENLIFTWRTLLTIQL